jgi:NRAMP (natural resistance-associated macrophage protein)-like metal ion transporter
MAIAGKENRALAKEPTRLRKGALFKTLGPGLITGAADDDPSGIATYSQAGAQYGVNMLWTMLLTYPLMTAVQLVSAQIGRVTGKGLAANLGRILPKLLVFPLILMLFVANTINIGANLAAMGAATKLVVGGPSQIYTVAFAVLSLTLQLFIAYERYSNYLKWLTLVLFTYIAVVFTVQLNWAEVFQGMVKPHFALDGDSATM